jgi:acyl-[acyl carrier protein]--UDP-N-acetylglucosamine O-acyltransferase
MNKHIEDIQKARIGEIRVLKDDQLQYGGVLWIEDDGSIVCYPTGAENFKIEIDIKLDHTASLGGHVSIKSKEFVKNPA